MKTVGIIGGIGPESTIAYYHLIVSSYRERVRDGSYPSIVIDSVDLKKIIDFIEASELHRLAEFLVDEVTRLARAGAEVGLLSANTPHVVFDEIERRSPIPLISIVRATCEAAQARGMKRLGLIGTRFTMQGRFYLDVFSKAGITLVVPEPEEQAYIHERYMGELVKGVFRPETRQGLLAIVDRMKERDGIQGLILGGTELPWILKEDAAGGIPFLDTTRIHVESLLARLLP
jgi:aspartate racemase